MDRSWDRGCHGPRAGAASVHVTELSWPGLQNPRPLIKDDGIAEVLLEEFLSPSKLQALAQVEDLRQVTVLEMCVDTRENSLGNFGAHLPNLSQLKLNNSLLASIRDLGSSLSHLQILWMVRCGLADLDGISSLRSLKELYMSYNNISDLSQICLLEHLEVLDLEGNNIENIEQVRYLSLCKKLNMLTLEGNLICLRPDPEAAEAPDYNYRAEVKKLIPHLQFLDDVPAAQTSLQATRKISEDWLIVKESIKESSADCSWFSLSRQSLSPSLRLSTNLFSPTPRPWPLPLDRLSWTIPLSSPGSPLPEGLFPEELSPDSSDLTHGVSRVLCGNPIKGLQERRQKLHDHSGRTTPQPLAPGSVGSRSQGPEELSGGEEDGLGWPQGLWAEYKSWKEEQQQQRLNMLLVGRSPPVWPQEEEEEEEEASMALEDQEEEEKAQGPPGPCPGSLSPAPGPSHAVKGGLPHLRGARKLSMLKSAPQEPPRQLLRSLDGRDPQSFPGHGRQRMGGGARPPPEPSFPQAAIASPVSQPRQLPEVRVPGQAAAPEPRQHQPAVQPGGGGPPRGEAEPLQAAHGPEKPRVPEPARAACDQAGRRRGSLGAQAQPEGPPARPGGPPVPAPAPPGAGLRSPPTSECLQGSGLQAAPRHPLSQGPGEDAPAGLAAARHPQRPPPAAQPGAPRYPSPDTPRPSPEECQVLRLWPGLETWADPKGAPRGRGPLGPPAQEEPGVLAPRTDPRVLSVTLRRERLGGGPASARRCTQEGARGGPDPNSGACLETPQIPGQNRLFVNHSLLGHKCNVVYFHLILVNKLCSQCLTVAPGCSPPPPQPTPPRALPGFAPSSASPSPPSITQSLPDRPLSYSRRMYCGKCLCPPPPPLTEAPSALW